MSYPTNILQQVTTYQESSLALLENLTCFVHTANKKFENFQNMTANLGSVVNFDRPYRFVASNGLPATFQPIQQLLQALTVDQAANTSYTVTDPQRIFNYSQQDYMSKIGTPAISELANKVESSLALNCTSAVPVTVNVNNVPVPTGALHTESGPYRFFGDGTTAISSYQQLAQMIANFKNFGAVSGGIKVILPDTIIPAIIGSGLSQFAPNRNNDIANSWEVGTFGTPPVEYYISNLLPVHVAGTLGQAGTTLTVVSTNDSTGENVTQIICSGAGTDSNAVKSGDLGSFDDGVSGFNDMRFLTYIGHTVSAQPVQFRITADAASSAGNVTLNITPGLCWQNGNANQNINQTIQAGMEITLLPSHRAGVIIGGDAFFLAMPRLPDQTPFPSASKMDESTGVSLLTYYGTIFPQAQQGIINATTWGSTMLPDYTMRIVVPV
jgi:hypothetical protein